MKQQSSYFVLILVLTHHILVKAQINWQSGAGGVQWAPACDFNNHDMGSAQIPGETCGEKCISTRSGCSHFAWTNYLGGTCWMKTGGAKFNSDDQTVCGIVPSSNPNLNHNPG